MKRYSVLLIILTMVIIGIYSFPKGSADINPSLSAETEVVGILRKHEGKTQFDDGRSLSFRLSAVYKRSTPLHELQETLNGKIT